MHTTLAEDLPSHTHARCLAVGMVGIWTDPDWPCYPAPQHWQWMMYNIVNGCHGTTHYVGSEGGWCWYKPDNGEAADIGLNIGCGGSLYCAQQRGTAQNTNWSLTWDILWILAESEGNVIVQGSSRAPRTVLLSRTYYQDPGGGTQQVPIPCGEFWTILCKLWGQANHLTLHHIFISEWFRNVGSGFTHETFGC